MLCHGHTFCDACGLSLFEAHNANMCSLRDIPYPELPDQTGMLCAIRAQTEDMTCTCRDAKCIVSLTRQFSNLAPVPKTPIGQIEGGLARSESLEMHTMSSAELKRRCCPTSAAMN